MKKILRLGIAAGLVCALMPGCILVMHEETTLSVYNSMHDMTIVAGNSVYPVEAIDLYGVTIGDVYFDYIEAGTISAEVETGYEGDVNISIETAVAYVSVAPAGQIEYTFNGIEGLSTYITADQENTVEFGTSTAGAIFSSQAKKPAR